VTLVDGTAVRGRLPWQYVLEALDEVVLLLNDRNVVTYASPSVGTQLGYVPGTLAGRSLGDVVHPDDLRAGLRALAELAVTGVVHVPMRLRRTDAEYVWLDCSLTRAAGPDGAEEVTVLSGRDGAARARLEERLAAADERYRALLAAMGEAVVFLDAHLRVEEVNARAAALLGRSPEELLGRGWFEGLDVWDENGRPVTPDGPFVRSLLLDPAPHEVWRSVLRPDGQRTLLRNCWTPMGSRASGLRGYVVTMQDAMGPRSAPSLPQQRRQARTAAGLTPREHQVLERLADGQDAMEIARELELSVYSVRGHIKSLMRKLKVHSQLQAVVVAARRGIVDVVGGGTSQLG
jgi:PAS domain S-box-containing protein